LNREDAKSAKVFIYFLIGTDDQEKNHALRAVSQKSRKGDGVEIARFVFVF